MKLSDLADALGIPQPAESEKKTGYDGKLIKLTITMDSKGRRGKVVTVIRGFQSSPQELDILAQSLKKHCGTGGGVGDNCIELQGNHIPKATSKLKEFGFFIKG